MSKKIIEVPAMVGNSIHRAEIEIELLVSLDDPRAAVYARHHLEQTKEPIINALKILAVHGQDVTQVANSLKRWLDREVAKMIG